MTTVADVNDVTCEFFREHVYVLFELTCAPKVSLECLLLDLVKFHYTYAYIGVRLFMCPIT